MARVPSAPRAPAPAGFAPRGAGRSLDSGNSFFSQNPHSYFGKVESQCKIQGLGVWGLDVKDLVQRHFEVTSRVSRHGNSHTSHTDLCIHLNTL